MPGALNVLELVRNGSLSAEMASTLWAAMDDRCSFIVAAGPRQAGKSTTTEAILDFLPASVPRHDLTGDRAQMDALAASPDGGYLVVSEFSDHTPSYLRGEQVVQVFDTAERGFSIAGTLHADTPEEAFYELRSHGSIPDSQLERIGCLVFLGVRGWPENPVRWVSSIWQVEGVRHGAPRGRLLCRWDHAAGEFVWENSAVGLSASGALREERAARIRELADAGRTSREDLAALLAS
ncbi:MAG: hypothetical protein OXN15_09880 [Chloroflexota bacterium]|nr:hypothetical protein [Chloroflexota bacterium]MDE2969003.1 hypothetical protein [Chloroflexota bacterium]